MAITILIADDIEQTRNSIKRLLSLDPDVRVIAEAADGKEAVKKTIELKPDIVLMDINMPGLDGIAATEQITLRAPETSVIIMSVQRENEYLRKAMFAGARDYIVKPFTNDELLDTIKRVYHIDKEKRSGLLRRASCTDPQVITFFGAKGGVGKTALAVNTAIALKQATRSNVVLVDLDLQFGDVAAAMNIKPQQSIAELVQEPPDAVVDLLEQYLVEHKPSGVKVLCAPFKPEQEEIVTQADTERILNILKEDYQYIIVDTSTHFSEAVLTALEMSNTILMVSALDVLTVKNTKLALHVLQTLDMHGKTDVVLNRTDETMGMKSQDLEDALGYKIRCTIPANGRIAVPAINKGIPFIITHPKTNIGEAIFRLSNSLIQGIEKPSKKKHKRIANLFGLFS